MPKLDLPTGAIRAPFVQARLAQPLEGAGPVAMAQPKLLLMGRAGAGKSSMKAVLFANCAVRDTMRLQPTHTVEQSSVSLPCTWDVAHRDGSRVAPPPRAHVLCFYSALGPRGGQRLEDRARIPQRTLWSFRLVPDWSRARVSG